ncbi:MAG: hypothetical protein ACYDEB_15180 [Dehalococcoidia bacterium]
MTSGGRPRPFGAGHVLPGKGKLDRRKRGQDMQFFIALGVLVTASTAYLVHQFWRRALAEAPQAPAGEAEDAAGGELKAA